MPSGCSIPLLSPSNPAEGLGFLFFVFLNKRLLAAFVTSSSLTSGCCYLTELPGPSSLFHLLGGGADPARLQTLPVAQRLWGARVDTVNETTLGSLQNTGPKDTCG